MLANLVDLHDVGMLEPGDGLALPAEPRALGRPRVGSRQDHLQGDNPGQPDLPCLVNNTHPAAAEDAQDLITRHGHIASRRHRRPTAM